MGDDNNNNNNEEAMARLESRLMRSLSDRIVEAEEAELMQRYDARIRRAEAKQQRRRRRIEHSPMRSTIRNTGDDNKNNNDDNPWSDLEDETAVTARALRRTAYERRLEARTFSNRDALFDSVEGLEYVKATKLIPRYIGARWTQRNDLEEYFLRKFKSHEGLRLANHKIYWKGFRLRLASANPNSWRLEVYGYRRTVNLLLQCLARMFGKAMAAQKKQQQLQQQQQQQQAAAPSNTDV